MKIKTRKLSYDEVLKIQPKPAVKTKRPNIFFRTLLRVVSVFDLWAVNFKFKRIGMEKLAKDEPCLILMNHSSFIDMEIGFIFPDKILMDNGYVDGICFEVSSKNEEW